MDVFFCTNARDKLRSLLSEVCAERWIMGTTNRRICPLVSINMSPSDYMLWHRAEAERMAEGSIYCHADDDCMPLGNRFLERATEIMERHPEYGLIAFTDYLNRRVGELGVSPAHAPGGIYLMRKGIVEFPGSHPWYDDVQMSGEILAKGFKVGVFNDIYFNHYGFGLSTTHPERTGLTQVVDP